MTATADPRADIAAPMAWRLRRCPKYASHGVVRAVPAAETVRRVTPLMEVIGVTRVAEVTGLDRTGIPNFTTVRPRERDAGISYYNGKGTTRSAAHAGALMEAVERYSGERCGLPVHDGTRDEVARLGAVVEVTDLVVPAASEYRPADRLEWVRGHDLLRDRPTWLPLAAVVCPYHPPPGRPVLQHSHTNGLASGNTPEEALCHALCEILERHAGAIADAATDLAPAVTRLLADTGRVRPAPHRGPQDAFPLIDLDTLPRRSTVLVARFRRAGLLVYLRDITGDTGVATVSCDIVEPQPGGRHLVHGGAGSHPDARVAVNRALTEAAQSRVGHIQGGREDLPHIVRPNAAFDPAAVFGSGPVRPYAVLPSREHADIDDDVRFLLERCAALGFAQVVAVDLTRPEVGVPVVRVVVPGAESWSVFYAHARRGRFGPRVAEILAGAPAVSGFRR